MKIRAQLVGEAIVCELSDGHQIEITMVSVMGEDVFAETDIQYAVRLIEENIRLFSSQA